MISRLNIELADVDIRWKCFEICSVVVCAMLLFQAPQMSCRDVSQRVVHSALVLIQNTM